MEVLIFAIVLFFVIILFCKIKQDKEYKDTSYYKITHNTYNKIETDKGLEGEFLIYQKLAEYEQDGAKLLFNCYIPKKDGKTTEIDVIMIHRSGIYIIESKNYSGWIFGSEYDETWTQSLLGRGYEAQKEHFFNPVLQNKLHIKHLCSLLNDDEQKMYSIVVFSDRCELKSITVTSPRIKVLQRHELKTGISEYMSQNLLTEAEVTKIYDLLYPYTQVSEKQRKEHLKNVNIDVSIREAKRGKICPRCGSALVERTVKKGSRAGHKFYGCSAYPKCYYTENIDKIN